MRNTMSIANLEYASLKKRGGLYNWGFVNREQTLPEQTLNKTEINKKPAEQNTHPQFRADDSTSPKQTP